MKKLFIIFLMFFSAAAIGQTSNSWIDYSKTYYKFTVGQTGLYRIPQSVLASLGLGSVPAEQFQLFRNGQEVILYTSIATGIFGSNDYIEFWGLMNDGKADTKLYINPDYQLSDHYSLQTDTAAFYLTVNPAGNNLRYATTSNIVAGTTLSPEPYFMNTRGVYYKNKINMGLGVPLGEYVYSSSYDIGEGWTSNDVAPNAGLSYLYDSLNVYANGPAASFNFAVAGNANNSRNISVSLYNNVIDNEPMSNFTYIKKQVSSLPASYLPNSDKLLVTIQCVSSVPTDRIVVSKFELTYPSTFNFNNQKNFYFELPATSVGNYVVINSFNYGATAPVLLDITSNKRYVGDITTTPGKVQFLLPPSSAVTRKFELVNEEAANISNITLLTQRKFIDFSVAANQGNYMIISHPSLFNDGTGINNVELYRQYRSSATGGAFNAKTYSIDELVDQFAYGIKKHPSSIKDFILYAAANFAVKPKYVFLIGKGITYSDYAVNQSSPYAEQLNLVPTFGNPASDVLLSSPYGITLPTVPIGRLSAISGTEVGNYLQKIKEYENAKASTTQTLDNKLWMKNVVHVIGGKDSSESNLFTFYMNQYKNIIVDTFYGAHVETFSKTSNSTVQLVSGERITQLFNEGIGFLSYFGHASANLLEFNLSDPTSYSNQGKYPFFLVNGCTAGNNYIFDPLRITQNNLSISENYVLANERGSIGFLASSHLGVPPYLYSYDLDFYNQLSVVNYGNTVGNFMKNVISDLGGANSSIDYLTRINMEEFSLNGDPAITVYPHALPDYVIEDPEVVVNPAFISVSQSSFTLKAKAFNIGKAISDSIVFQVTRTYPNGTSEIILRKKIAGIRYADSIEIQVPIIATRDKGLNRLTVTIDADNNVQELSETNNTITRDVYIYEDEAMPAYPYDYAIINVGNQKLYASTANPLSVAKDYLMEIDTTLLFNSSSKVSKTVTAPGGIIQFDPGFSYRDSTVYYWRVAVKTASGADSTYHWNNSSFVYLSTSAPGSNQSHYYQHLASDTQNLTLDSSRHWTFSTISNFIYANFGLYPTYPTGAQTSVTVNGSNVSAAYCAGFPGLVFTVLDPISLKPLLNNSSGPGRFGSEPVCGATRLANFQFNNLNQSRRKQVSDFLDSIPNNDIVVARYISYTSGAGNTYASEWAADSSVYGVNNTMYAKLKAQGFVLIDSFYRTRTFIFMYQKNNPSFEPDFIFSKGTTDAIELQKPHITPDSVGYITSPKFGPAISWKQMHWRGSSADVTGAYNPKVSIIGIDSLGNSNTLFNVDKTQQDVDISSVSATRYPYIQLQMRNADSISFTPYQLSYWRLNYTPAPEGAIAPNLYFMSADTLNQGDTLHFGIAFKNISLTAFDSMKINVAVIDINNVTHTLPVARRKPLISGDTIILKYDIDTKQYQGANTLLVDFNPANDQPEEYHFNNFIYKSFFIKSDKFNPLLDVTFDGVHILNNDIVSAKPHIIAKLKDENKSLALNDTSLMKVQIQFPDGSLRTYKFDNDTLKFTPANLATGDNTATIDLAPVLTGTSDADDNYTLIVSGKDVAGNPTGTLNYHVNFRVISKPMISNFLNYPNPFTTATAFVFTITGSVVPQNIRIEILTITGKIIKEITTQELGPLHIGRNVTEYRWDGSDMYGQKVANGVYLYRVLTNLNGKSLDKFHDDGDNTDKYFTKGYGKMYFMR